MEDGWNTTSLAVGPECPYPEHKFASLEWKALFTNGQTIRLSETTRQNPGGIPELGIITGPGNDPYHRSKKCLKGKSCKVTGHNHG